MLAQPTLASRITSTWAPSREGLLLPLLLILAGSVFIALSAQLALRLPFSPVPVTGQTFAILVIGMAYGSRLGALTVLAYLLEGLFLPVFAEWRTWSHPATIWTAGYLVGFVGAAYLVGFLAERGWDKKPLSTALAMMIGNGIIYLFGMVWLGVMFAPTISGGIADLTSLVLAKGFVPFLIGDGLKIVLAMLAFPLLWQWLNRRG